MTFLYHVWAIVYYLLFWWWTEPEEENWDDLEHPYPDSGSPDSGIGSGNGDVQKLLIFLNPKSGPGRARRLFQERVVPVLAEADCLYELHVTKHANFARSFVRSKDISRWRGIVTISGDGLLFEVINGLMERPDWEEAIRTPLGIIPGGSGNGLAKAVSFSLGEPYDQNPVLISTLNVVKGRSVPMDLVRVETPTKTMYSFLSIGWGLMSDIDIESEKARNIGPLRFTVWSVARLISLRTYQGRLSYLPASEKSLSRSQISDDFRPNVYTSELNGISRSISYQGDLRGSGAHERTQSTSTESMRSIVSTGEEIPSVDWRWSSIENLPNQANNTILGPKAVDVKKQVNDSGSRPRLDSFYSVTSRRTTYYSTGGGSLTSFHSAESEDFPIGTGRIYGPPPRIPALNKPVPSDWTVIDGDFVLVHASYQSHISSDVFVAPEAKLADGIIWLLIIRSGITKSQLLQFLLSLSNGTHVNSPLVEMIPVQAFRLEPQSEGGYMTVDGEKVDYGPIQAEIMPSLARVMSR